MKVSKNEKEMVSHIFDGVECYVTAQNTINGKFTLYKVINKDYEKMITADSPLKFDEVIKKDRSANKV